MFPNSVRKVSITSKQPMHAMAINSDHGLGLLASSRGNLGNMILSIATYHSVNGLLIKDVK